MSVPIPTTMLNPPLYIDSIPILSLVKYFAKLASENLECLS